MASTANNISESNNRFRRPVVAVFIAALLLVAVGTTLAYLASSSEPVTNTFVRNQVMVDLTETTGSTYNIVPGTYQDKDPAVRVESTIDAYVFAIVTDSTQGLVTYSIADGWTELDTAQLTQKPNNLDVSGSNVKVYYRSVSGSTSKQSFAVLQDNKVFYPNIAKEPGSIELTFQAYAIQKEPFNDPVKAWNQEVTAGGDDQAPKVSITETVIDENGIVTVDVPEQLVHGGAVSFTMMPTHALTFTMDEDPDKSEYANWYADFAVSFDRDMVGATMTDDRNTTTLGQVVFYGNYGTWGNVPLVLWNVNDPSASYTLPAGSRYRLLLDGMNWRMTYSELKEFGVSPFNCGVTVKKTDDDFYDVSSAAGSAKGVKSVYPNGLLPLAADSSITLELRLYNPDDESESILCASGTYMLPAS